MRFWFFNRRRKEPESSERKAERKSSSRRRKKKSDRRQANSLKTGKAEEITVEDKSLEREAAQGRARDSGKVLVSSYPDPELEVEYCEKPIIGRVMKESFSQHRMTANGSNHDTKRLQTGFEEKNHPVKSDGQFTGEIKSSYLAPSESPAPIYEEASQVVKAYDAIPNLEQQKLSRGGISMETQAVGRVQFGIPPETIKDSMRAGIPVPAIYIVPMERFCRDMGPALGVNLAEFEFPAYYNFFILKKRCTLVVDSEEAERNIRRVFSETLLGPAQFRRQNNPIPYEEEDFAPDFPRDKIPNFPKELKHFRLMEDGKELVLETLLKFCHFDPPGESGAHENLGVPPLTFGDSGDEGCPTSDAATPHETQDGRTDLRSKDLKESQKNASTQSQAQFDGHVATVWPSNATPEQIEKRSCKRVEIFKMATGAEYILHDVDENNIIIGKARFRGDVPVPETMSVDGFGGHSIIDNVPVDADESEEEGDKERDGDEESDDSDRFNHFIEEAVVPKTFHPPSFGVTVLGNSHGFDQSGSVSGYVLWINGRGVMVDPPPYSSATLEREGIRPRTVVGVILTHCHADHDAGAFQKVLTGSPVAVITTPTIYKSFIRKYAALSALSPALLRHSHRHTPAIIGQPLRFQGATFHFFYTLHTIPCVGFRVEWRGRSMVFTGDHFNSPPAIDMLEQTGVLSKARADDLRNLPLQETDLLLHEAGAPPVHTPLSVLLQLPPRVKERLRVVHTTKLPKGCELEVAPTGTDGTIRLSEKKPGSSIYGGRLTGRDGPSSLSLEDDGMYSSPWIGASNEYDVISEDTVSEHDNDPNLASSFASLSASPHMRHRATHRNSLIFLDNAPAVSLRPASSTDAWFILNLLSAVPFLTSLSYLKTLEVLETARVDAYCQNDIIVPSERRNQVLCVVWEGTCVEREKRENAPSRRGSRHSGPLIAIHEMKWNGKKTAVWYAGDWTGPIALQPEKKFSGESETSRSHDIVAMSQEGVKVITVEFSSLHAILKSGSPLYRKYLERQKQQVRSEIENPTLIQDAKLTLNVLQLLNCNYTLRRLSAVQKRHLESLAEGPVTFQPGERLWEEGAPVDRAYIVVTGKAFIVPRRRNAGSVGLPSSSKFLLDPRASESSAGSHGDEDQQRNPELSIGQTMLRDAILASKFQVDQPATTIQLDTVFSRPGDKDALADSKKLRPSRKRSGMERPREQLLDSSNIEFAEDEETLLQPDSAVWEGGNQGRPVSRDRRAALSRRRSSKARIENNFLRRVHNNKSLAPDLVFGQGHFLGDVSTMVAGLLSSDGESEDTGTTGYEMDDDSVPKYGFGEKTEGGPEEHGTARRGSASGIVIHEQKGEELIVHSSTLTAGKAGCVVFVFPKSSLIPFLDEYPGLLLSLLGTPYKV